MMKMDVKHQEMVKTGPVSNTCPSPHTLIQYTHKSPFLYSFSLCQLQYCCYNPQFCASFLHWHVRTLFLSPTVHMMSTPIFVIMYYISVIILIMLYLFCAVYNLGQRHPFLPPLAVVHWSILYERNSQFYAATTFKAMHHSAVHKNKQL